MSEFDLIDRFFKKPASSAYLGIGDDAALLKPNKGCQLAISTDMMVAGTHFLMDCHPYLIGWKSLAVNISDMAAMGADPRWATLAIALPRKDEAWLEGFSNGFFDCAKRYHVELIGGDTTRGPLNICVQIIGEVPDGKALRRDGARAGDDIWVSGNLGDAALALSGLQGQLELDPEDLEVLRVRLEHPEPRVMLGSSLRDIATSAIDISDGLVADLGHILKASRAGGVVEFTNVPHSRTVSGYLQQDSVKEMVLSGGDDYELCFTASPGHRDAILAIAEKLALKLSRIGTVTDLGTLTILDSNQQAIPLGKAGFDHFA